MSAPRTLLDKLWQRAAVVQETADHPAVLYVDLHLLHEVTSSQAFAVLAERGLSVHAPERTLALTDHAVPTRPPVSGEWPFANGSARRSVALLEKNCRENGIALFSLAHDLQGIVHVVAPELGLTWPGSVIACGDSHTSTQGAYGALAFGIGTSEVACVLASQTMLMKKPRALKVELCGSFIPKGVSAKDISLAVLATVGVGGAHGGVIEFTGEALALLSMEERMTLCNQSVEAGARTAVIAVDEVTLADLQGRPGIPQGADWETLRAEWFTLRSDADSVYDAAWCVDVTQLEPRVTYGTFPALSVPVTSTVPLMPPQGCQPQLWNEGLHYMNMQPGQRLNEIPVQHVFIGSCTNGRLSDLRAAAQILAGRTIAAGVTAWVVPGSRSVKRAAEQEGLHEIFQRAGAQWREPGCSLCVAMNGDVIPPGEVCVSTSNRNFAHRQGPHSRTFLVSPATAAATAVRGFLADPREVLP